MHHDFNSSFSLPQLIATLSDHAGCDPEFDHDYAELDREFQSLRLHFNE